METKEPTKTLVISLQNIVDDDPELVAIHGIASDAFDLLEDVLTEVCGIEISDREQEILRRWTLYFGTLAAEIVLAGSHLAVADNPRAQIVLNRSLFEYFIRNQYMLRHPAEAVRLMDSLEGIVGNEVRKTSGLFDATTRQAIQANYDAWATQHPDLEKEVSSEVRFTAMAKDVMDADFQPEFFYTYGLPSIIAHGKPQGVPDVFTPLGMDG